MRGGIIKTTFSNVLFGPIKATDYPERGTLSAVLVNKISGNNRQMKRRGDFNDIVKDVSSINNSLSTTTIYVNDDIMRPGGEYGDSVVKGHSSNYYYWIFKSVGDFTYEVLKNMSGVSFLCVGGGGHGGSAESGISNGGGGGGNVFFNNQGVIFQVGDRAIFSVGWGGDPSNSGRPDGFTSEIQWINDNGPDEEFRAGGGQSGNSNAGGEGSTYIDPPASSNSAYAISQGGGNGGDNGDNGSGGFGTSNMFTFSDGSTYSIPSELTELLVSNGIPGDSWGGGGGGAKDGEDNTDFSGGQGAVNGYGGANGINNTLPSNGTNGIYGGGGGAAGWDDDDAQRYLGGKGGDGFIFFWIRISDVRTV